MKIQIKTFDHAKGLPLPAYATEGSAGMDLYAACQQNMVLEPGKAAIIPSGISIALPCGYEAQIRSRSGLTIKSGIVVLNSPGTVDSDYRGEIGMILCNFGQKPFIVERGARIAQMIISQYAKAEWEPVSVLESTSREDGGFGSTGL